MSPSVKALLRRAWEYMRGLVNISAHIDVAAASESIRNNVAFRGPNVIILFCAIVIASVGLNVNSIPVIIGAMLISPLMSPIIGFGLGLGTNDTSLIRSALKNLGIMVGISILASTLYFLLSPLDMEHPTELLARTNPTIYDVLIALFGGFAGILEISRKEKGTVMSGVAIATALMPPLCTVGYGIATWQHTFALGALYLFFINSVFIALAAFLGTKYLGYPVIREGDPQEQRKRTVMIGVLMTIVLVPSVISAYTVVVDNNFSRNVSAFVRENKTLGRSYIIDYTVHTESSPRTVELFIAGEPLSGQDSAQLYTAAERYGLLRTQVICRQEATTVAYSPLSEQQLVKDILRAREDQLANRDSLIIVLRERADSLQQCVDALRNGVTMQQELTMQVEKEIMSQYAGIQAVTIAQTTDNTFVVLLQTSPKYPLHEADRKRLNEWLPLRLDAPAVQVIEHSR